MTEWLIYLAAWAAFLVSHVIPLRPRVKAAAVARLGPRGFTLAYSAVSLAALSALIASAGAAPQVPLWDWAPWQRTLAQAATLAACMLIAFAAFAPNPLSFGGWHNDRFDPARPGIAGLLRHPWLAALALWAAGHVPVSGDLAHVVLFGGFAVFALLGMRMIDARRQRQIGMAEWRRLANGPATPPPQAAARIVAGAALWVVLIRLHPHIIGPDAWP
jgi:uncharacterized membrane protein